MATLGELIGMGRAADAHRPWPRVVVDAGPWRLAADELRDGCLTLLGLWGDRGAVHMALLDDAGGIAILSLDCATGHFPSVSALHPPAIRLERTIRDLFGLEPEGAPDTRAWLDHGNWDVSHPLDGRMEARDRATVPYVFLPAEGESLHQIAVGPVHAGIIEPGHFRFTAGGETVVRLEERLGYAHKGIERLMEGAGLDHAAKLAGRTSGDSTVAYAIAFARAAEAALGIDVPPRAHWLRALMAELERLANHFGDIGAICNDASFALMQAHCAVLRERVLRAADAGFGHRLMRDCVAPGGVAAELKSDGITAIRTLVDEARRRFPALIALYDNTASLQNRTVGAGVLRPELARRFGAGGFVGRASGRIFDARRMPGYAPYGELKFDVPTRTDGDVNARVWIRIREVEQSLELINQLLDHLPPGSIHSDYSRLDRRECVEGAALVEGFRGDILVWLRLGVDGTVERCHLRDPSWFQWPLLEAAIEGNIVADFPLCNKSFNCSYSGHDL
jgi:Ni,Fe-hydrogenase III large subunit